MNTSPKLFLELCYEHSLDKSGLETMPTPVSMQIIYPEGITYGNRSFDRKRLGMIDVPVEIIKLMLANDVGDCGFSGTSGYSEGHENYVKPETNIEYEERCRKSIAASSERSALISKWLYENIEKVKWGVTHSPIKLNFKEVAYRYLINYERLRTTIGVTPNGKIEALAEALSHFGVTDKTLYQNYVNLFIMGEMSKDMFPEHIPGDEELKRKPDTFVRMTGSGRVIVITEREYLRPGFIDRIMDETQGYTFDRVLIESSIFDRVMADSLLVNNLCQSIAFKEGQDSFVSTEIGEIDSLIGS